VVASTEDAIMKRSKEGSVVLGIYTEETYSRFLKRYFCEGVIPDKTEPTIFASPHENALG
jgi:hypothetical protein